MKLKKNDLVMVRSGRERGKKGKILKLFPEPFSAIVEGLNMVKKHMRKTRDNPKGGIILRESPIRVPNLVLVCPRCSKRTRVGFLILTDGTKRRVCKKCKEIL